MTKSDHSRRNFLIASGMGMTAVAWAGPGKPGPATTASGDPHVSTSPLRIVVMDPLSAPLACGCVAGYAQRDYGVLAGFLQDALRRDVLLAFTESLATLTTEERSGIDLIVGKSSVVQFDALRTDLAVRRVAQLTGKAGKTTQRGLFVVRSDDRATSISDLRGYRIEFGPVDSEEKHAAALAALKRSGLPAPTEFSINSACSTAALAVVENDADAAVVSSYAMPLLEGCGAVDKGALRIVGRTKPVRFVELFATDRIGNGDARAIAETLTRLKSRPGLLTALESKEGFRVSASTWA